MTVPCPSCWVGTTLRCVSKSSHLGRCLCFYDPLPSAWNFLLPATPTSPAENCYFCLLFSLSIPGWSWWGPPVIPALERQRQDTQELRITENEGGQPVSKKKKNQSYFLLEWCKSHSARLAMSFQGPTTRCKRGVPFSEWSQQDVSPL